MLNNIAVLIDADNASAKTIDEVLQAIEKLGRISTKKIYGDWSMTGLSASWQEAILRHAIDPMQQFAYVKGKNATDIALVIEAMDLLHSGEYDGFCLVSSDSDFASLAVRIRKSGIKVYGFGRKEAVMSFRQACDEFFEVENLNGAKQEPTKSNQPAQKDAWDSKKLKGDTKLLNALRDSVIQNTKDGWANYSQIVTYFKENHGDIDIKKYGYHKLIELYQVIDVFSVNTNKETKQLVIKIKDGNKSQPTNQKYTSAQLQSDKTLITAIETLITNNPKSEQGWCNISYIASELNKNPDIDVNKYGYKKFSDLITAIRLFDIKKQPNGVYVKLKNQKPTKNQTPIKNDTETHKPLTISDITQTPLILNNTVTIYVYRETGVDSVLWRLADNKKVRRDGDFIFYGQTQSDDDNISLDNHATFDAFECQLPAQDDDIRQMVVSVSHESDVIESVVKVAIEQEGRRLFVGEFVPSNQTSKSAILLVLAKVGQGWQVVPRSQFIGHDLRGLCTAFGVEVDD